jgi:hypothetical protein
MRGVDISRDVCGVAIFCCLYFQNFFVLIHIKGRKKENKVTQLSNFRKFDFAQDALPPELIVLELN